MQEQFLGKLVFAKVRDWRVLDELEVVVSLR